MNCNDEYVSQGQWLQTEFNFNLRNSGAIDELVENENCSINITDYNTPVLSDVKFPTGFVQIMYPGYFWHPESSCLFSLKTGVLKPLSLNKFRGARVGGEVRLIFDPNFAVSVKGRTIRLSRLWLRLGRFTSNKQEIRVANA